MRNKGFTLVELLVVIAIIGILIGLLLPAVQSVRESARSMQCSNNLKQMALACMNAESLNKCLPSAGFGYNWLGNASCGSTYKQPGSWLYAILPFIEQQSIFDVPSGATHAYDPINATYAQRLIQSPVSAFHCPSRRGSTLYANTTGKLTNAGAMPNKAAKTDYACNSGTYSGNGSIKVPGFWAYPGPSAAQVKTYEETSSWPNYSNEFTGVIHLFSQTRVAQIQDGLSNTFLVGEKYLPVDVYESLYFGGGSVAGNDDYSSYCGCDHDCARTTFCGKYKDTTFTINSDIQYVHKPAKDIQYSGAKIGGRNADEVPRFSFGSAHASSCIMALCDASVMRVSYNMDPGIYQCMGDRADGQIVSSEQ